MTTPIDSASSAEAPTATAETPASAEAPSTATDFQDAPEQAASSPAEGAKHENLLALVKSVVRDAEAPPANGTAEESGTQKTKGAESQANPAPSGDADAKTETKTEDDESLPFHKHPRWQAVIKERDEARGQVTVYKEKAAQFDAISDYMAESRISPQDVNRGFEIMAAIRNDPSKALTMLSETITYLKEVTGENLSPEIQKMVDDAEMSEDAARQLSRARAQSVLQEQRHNEHEEQQQRIQAQQAHGQIISAVEDWEAKVMSRDPDYKAKRSLVLQNIRIANLETPARTPAEALAIAEAAYTKATETAKGLRPPPVEIKGGPTSEQTLPKAKPQPKSLLDVVKGAVS